MSDILKAYARGMTAMLGERGVYIPHLLLRSYRELGLTDTDAMLLLQLMAFREAESKEFPTPEEIAHRLGTSPKTVVQLLGKLMKDGLLEIDEALDPVSGILYERYNWSGWLQRAALWAAEEELAEGETAQRELGSGGGKRTASAAFQPLHGEQMQTGGDMFTLFEQEFGRPLSPMECETISGWLDQDRYPDELIRFALKEAVFAGKLHFRYIDRILLEWSRNRVNSVEEARAHAAKFRGGRG
ncbi:DnaD domain-containing protein [Paenibacillus beijingensis]|uniref:DNA replication protein DnaD n=1 Tax=Paenibacillus beijingensis TaxID=1126833 RepID=A0A0D5NSL7_9BACL|nr:DnaD domain-containing protein [Paenibacillus beijingensis]AJY78007.1 DNA replication protein DnaD [Paenibacillus beijingensis]